MGYHDAVDETKSPHREEAKRLILAWLKKHGPVGTLQVHPRYQAGASANKNENEEQLV